MDESTAIVEVAEQRPLCWICHNPLKCLRPPKTATGLCQRCYSREYQRAVRTQEPMVRTPDDARRLGRADLLACLENLPPPPAPRRAADTPAPAPRKDSELKAAHEEIDRLRLRLAQLQPVADAARTWWRGPFLQANVGRLKLAVEALNRADGIRASRAVDDDD